MLDASEFSRPASHCRTRTWLRDFAKLQRDAWTSGCAPCILIGLVKRRVEARKPTTGRKIYSSRTVRYAQVRRFTQTDAVTVSRENALLVRVHLCTPELTSQHHSASTERYFDIFSTRKFNQFSGVSANLSGATTT